jgi:hypothetical protein
MRYYNGHLDDIGPDLDQGLPPERQGYIRQGLGYQGRYYICIDAGDPPGNYSAVLCYNGTGYNEDYRAPGGSKIRQIWIQTMPEGWLTDRMWISQEEDILWIPIAKNPLKDANYRFTSTGQLISSWKYGDLKDVQKYFDSETLFTKNLLAGHRTVTLEYQLDGAQDSDAWSALAVYDTSPIDSNDISSMNNVSGMRYRTRMTLATDDPTQTPQVIADVLYCVIRKPPKKSWAVTFLVGDFYIDLDNTKEIELTVESIMAQYRIWSDSGQTPAPLFMRSIYPDKDSYYVFIESPTIRYVTTESEKSGTVTTAICTMTIIEA